MPIEDLMKKYGYSLGEDPSLTGDIEQWSSSSSDSSDQTYHPPNPKLFSPAIDHCSVEQESLLEEVLPSDQPQIMQLVVPSAVDLASGRAAEGVPIILVNQCDSSLVCKTKRVVGRKPVHQLRRGADPEALARLRPVPERRSMRPLTAGTAATLDSTFGKHAWLNCRCTYVHVSLEFPYRVSEHVKLVVEGHFKHSNVHVTLINLFWVCDSPCAWACHGPGARACHGPSARACHGPSALVCV